MFGDWREYLTRNIPEEDVQALRHHERLGGHLATRLFLPVSKKHWDGLCGRARADQKDPGGRK
jgi:hypothetical protein